jgi:predicted lipoprotein
VNRRVPGWIALGSWALVAIVVACRKPTPDEIVYTGATAKGTATSTTPRPPVAVDPGFDKHALLLAEADCAVDRYRVLESRARALRDVTRTFAGDPSAANAAAAKDAWLATMLIAEETEVFRFGPAARSTEPGGKDLRDEMYPWPLFSRCRTEEQLVDRTYAKPDFGKSIVNGRGLTAYEYLVFYPGTDNACAQFSVINTQKTWAGLGDTELAKRKAEYAAAVADDVFAHATALLQAWDPAAGNFHAQLSKAGTGSTVYTTDQAAFNAVSDALFYLENEAKDMKLARPLGILDCEDTTCPQAVESPYARASAAHLRANLRGFKRLFLGCTNDAGEGLGFDDFLRAAGAGDLADRMIAALADAELAIDSLAPSFEDVVANEPARGRTVHARFKKMTDLLKVEFMTDLNLEPPKGTEGDND